MTLAQQQLVLDYIGLALHLAGKRDLPRWIARDQIRSAAYWGLCVAAMRWGGLVPFRAYAKAIINHAITDEIRWAGFTIGRRSDNPKHWDDDSELWLDRYARSEPLDALIAQEEREWLYGAIERLSPTQRKVVHEMLGGKTSEAGHKNRWKAYHRLREMART